MKDHPNLNYVVALLADVPEAKLFRGQVGTVVEALQAGRVLVEFADDAGRAYAITPIESAQLLVLHYEREVACL